MQDLLIRSRADGSAYRKAAQVVEQASWSRMGFLNYTQSHYAHYDDLLTRYPEYQLCLVDGASGYVVAAANCAPLEWHGSELPEEGWDWAVARAAEGGTPNLLCALAISVPELHRSRGLARRMISAMRALADARGYDGMIAPVRPSSKSRHPEMRIDRYVAWRDPEGRLYDSWMRSHEASGGEIVRPCHRSMVVDEPLGFWETWLGRSFDRSGDYLVAHALTPVSVDLETGRGRYEEPNVWFRYPATPCGEA